MTLGMDDYPQGFEEDDRMRSAFIRDLTLHLLDRSRSPEMDEPAFPRPIPKTLIRYWHDQSELPGDVRECLDSWDPLLDQGFEVRMFSDESAADFIAERFGVRESEAFARCWHPAMRSDYLRMCVVFEDGGLYVDADDVLRGEGLQELFGDGRLKLQPLCYDLPTGQMVPATHIWRGDLPTSNRIFYVNNNPIAAPAGHPVLQTALARSTSLLLREDRRDDIQSTTGPGNMTAALAAHAHELFAAGAPLDFDLLRDWDEIAMTRWDLSYRDDERNWRNMSAC